MRRVYIERCASDIMELAERLNWKIDDKRIAETGSIYIDLRRGDEWVTIRVSDHKQVYHKHLTTYSYAPCDMHFDDFEELLAKPYGTVGDVMPNDNKLIWVQEGKAMTCYPYRYPYGEGDVIKEGIPYEEWMKLIGDIANEKERTNRGSEDNKGNTAVD